MRIEFIRTFFIKLLNFFQQNSKIIPLKIDSALEKVKSILYILDSIFHFLAKITKYLGCKKDYGPDHLKVN